jgi:hypothetical protein
VTRKVGYYVLDTKQEVESIGSSLYIAKVLKSDKYHLIVGPRRKPIPVASKAA